MVEKLFHVTVVRIAHFCDTHAKAEEMQLSKTGVLSCNWNSNLSKESDAAASAAVQSLVEQSKLAENLTNKLKNRTDQTWCECTVPSVAAWSLKSERTAVLRY